MTSSKLWKRYVSNRNVEETPRHLSGRPKLTPPNVNIIEFLKKTSPTITGKEIQDKIKRYFPFQVPILKIVLVIKTRIHKYCYKISIYRLHKAGGSSFGGQSCW